MTAHHGAKTAMSSKLLITGFGPFPGVPVNPSAALVERLAAFRLKGVATCVLPTRWDAWSHAPIAPAVNTVVMFGVAAGARRIRYERLSSPAASAMPDVDGIRASNAPWRSRHTALPVLALVARARAAGFPVVASGNAGRYVCNASYGEALRHVPRSLFVHIPLPTRRGPLSLDGLTAHALWLIAQLNAGGRP